MASTVVLVDDDARYRRVARRALELEGVVVLVKVQFGEQGTNAQLLATLRSAREHAEEVRAEHAALAADLLLPTTRFPKRRHVNELVMNFMWEQNETVIRWAAWAEQQVSGWPDDISLPEGSLVGDFLRVASEPPRH